MAGWEADAVIGEWARRKGFGPSRPLTSEGLRGLSNESAGRPSGLYLWESANHEIYVGISQTDVTRRLRDHITRHPDIQAFRYMARSGTSTQLRVIERALVHSVEEHGFVHRGKEHASTISGASVLDDLVSEAEQDRWLHDPEALNLADRSPLPELPSHSLAATQGSFRKFLELPEADVCLTALGAYLACCVPFPRRTEATFWTVSVLPSWSKSRMLTVSMAMLEMFYIYREADGTLSGILETDKRALPQIRGFRTIRTNRVLKATGARVLPGQHTSGGAFEQQLIFRNIEDIPNALAESDVIREGAAQFALDRMRMRQSNYKNSHNRGVASRALEIGLQWD